MSFIKHWRGHLSLVLSALFLSVLNAYAGTISISSVTEGSLETTAITTYTFTFTPQTTINSGNWSDGAYFWFDFDDDYTVSGATLGSISPSITGMAINNKNDSNGQIRMYTSSGAINGGTTYTVTLNNVQNPAVAQTPVNHVIKTGDGSSQIDTGAITAKAITAAASNPPVVQTPISDVQDQLESAGVVQYIADLNNHFLDGDGDTMTFSASSSDSNTVAVSLSGINNRTLSLQAKKYGSANITVTATATDGFVDDVFNVTTIGQLPINSVSEGSLETTATTSYTFTFAPETTVNSAMWSDGAYFRIDLDDDFTVSGATLGSITPSITGMSITNKNNSNGQILLHTNTGAITGGQQYIVVLNNVQNPASPQTPVDHVISTLDGANTIDIGSISANTITSAPTNPPIVSSEIPDKTGLKESEGTIQYIADLNNHFTDGDGDTMTFSALSNDTSVVTVTLSGTNNKILSLAAKKYGSTTVEVTATATDGQITDTFNVSTIGALTINTLSTTSNASSQSTNITVNFTLETTVSDAGGDGAYLYFDLPSQYGVDGSTTISVTSPSVSGTSYRSAGASDAWFIATNSTIPAGTYTATINNVTNPDTGGSFGNLTLDTRDGGGTTFDIGSHVLPTITTTNYTVTYDGNSNTGGTPPTDSNTYLIGDKVTVLGNTGSLVRTGYTFLGWNDSPTGAGTTYNGGDTFSMGSSDVTLYAEWTANPTYTVTYDGNNNTAGTPPTDANLYETSDTVTVQGNTGNLTRTGYTFIGWNTAANGSGTSYVATDTFPMGSANVTLYAEWTADPTYTVTYDGNNNTSGTPPTDANNYLAGDTVTVLDNTGALTRTGYTFLGWNTAADGTGTPYVAGNTFSMGSSNVTIYAHWLTNNPTHTVTYDGNNNDSGTVPTDSNSYIQGETVTVKGNSGNLSRSGYRLIGWNTAANGSGTDYKEGDTFSMGAVNVTLYAHWTEATPWILFMPTLVKPKGQ